MKIFINNNFLKYSFYKRLFPLFFLVITLSLPAQETSELLKGHIKSKLNRIDELLSLKNYNLALTKIEELESYSNYVADDKNKLDLLFKKAKAYYGNNDQQKAMELLLGGLDELEKTDFVKLKIKYSKYLGEIFKSSNDLNRSFSYFKKSLQNAYSVNDTTNILDSYLQIASIFYNQSKTDSAINYYGKIIEFNTDYKNEKIISKAFNNLSIIYTDNDEFDLAEEYAQKSLKIKRNFKDTIGAALALMNINNVLYKKGRFKEVEKNYLEAYHSIKDINSKKALNVKEYLLYNIAYVNEELNDFKNAYKYLLDANELTDSLAEADVAQNISEIEAKYNFEKQARVAEEEKRKRSQAQALFYGTALVFLTLLALGYIFYRNYRLKQQNKLEQIENQTQTKIINATIDAKEKERKAIAETLHDSVSALLSSANLHLQATKAQLKKEAPHEVTKAQTIVNEASVKIRDLSHELISSVLLKFGLAFAVHDMCQKYSNSEINIHSDDDGIKRYHQDFEIKIHNIIEELINNILKHSKASNATIMLAHKENDMLSVRISDDGVGFNPKSVRGKDGLGLSHIEARIKVMNGVFNIVSSKNNGTNIFILVPIQFKTKAVSA